MADTSFGLSNSGWTRIDCYRLVLFCREFNRTKPVALPNSARRRPHEAGRHFTASLQGRSRHSGAEHSHCNVRVYRSLSGRGDAPFRTGQAIPWPITPREGFVSDTGCYVLRPLRVILHLRLLMRSPRRAEGRLAMSVLRTGVFRCTANQPGRTTCARSDNIGSRNCCIAPNAY